MNFFTREFDLEGVLVENEATDQIDLRLDDGRVLSLEEVLIHHLDHRVRLSLAVSDIPEQQP